jgi:hypothetical protein
MCYNEITKTAFLALSFYFKQNDQRHAINSVYDVAKEAVEFNVALEGDVAWTS